MPVNLGHDTLTFNNVVSLYTTIHTFTFVKADKGNTTVIISTDGLHNKVYNFMEQNNITELKHDPTDRYQNTVKRCV